MELFLCSVANTASPSQRLHLDRYSISIDQGNVHEKTVRVSMMFEIYSGASAVMACIGPHADNSELRFAEDALEKAATDEENVRAALPGPK